MKKLISISLAALMLATNVLASNINVQLDGQAVEFSAQQPVIVDGRTLIPLRGVFEQLGYEITWDSSTKTAAFIKSGSIVKITVNSKKFTINGESKPLDVPAQIINGSMLLPLRAVGEATGLGVEWDNATKTVSLLTGEATEATTEEKSGATIDVEIPDEDAEEIKAVAGDFLKFDMTTNLIGGYYVTFMSNTLALGLSMETEDEDTIKEVVDEAKNYNKVFKESAQKLIDYGCNEDILNDLIDITKFTDDIYDAMLTQGKDQKSRKKQYDAQYSELEKNYEKMQKSLSEKVEKEGDRLAVATSETKYNLIDEDNINSAEKAILDSYYNSIAPVVEKETGFIADIDDDNYYVSNFGIAADKIRAKIHRTPTPMFCEVDKEAMLECCDLLDMAASYVEKGLSEEDMNTEYAVFNSIMITVDHVFEMLLEDKYTMKYLSDEDTSDKDFGLI